MDASPAAELDEYHHGLVGFSSEQQPFVPQQQRTATGAASAATFNGGSNARRKKHRQLQQQYTASRVRGQPMELSGSHIGISPTVRNNNGQHGASLPYPVYQHQLYSTASDAIYQQQRPPYQQQQQQLPELAQSTMPRGDRQMLKIPPPPLGPPPPPPESAARDSFVSSVGGSTAGESPYSVAVIDPEQHQHQHQHPHHQQQQAQQTSTNSFLLYGNRQQQLQQQQQQQLYLMSAANAGGDYSVHTSLMRHQTGVTASQTTPPGQYMPNGSGSTIDNSCKPLCSEKLSEPPHPVQRDVQLRCERPRTRQRLIVGLLALLVVLLIAALAVLAVRSRLTETCLSNMESRNSTIFGGFDPNSPPAELEDRRVYRVDLPGHGFWSGKLLCRRHLYAIVNVTLPYMRPVGLYMRRNSVPTLVQRDFFHRLENVQQKSRHSQAVVRYLTPGAWFITLANDQLVNIVVQVEVFRTEHEFRLKSCLNECSNRGFCQGTTCSCFQGFMGPDCSVADAVEICSGNGYLDRGACHCTAQWKGRECELPWSECPDPLCSGNGRCRAGRCDCFDGFGGDRCQNVTCAPPDCNRHGVCQQTGRCRCFAGWSGADCLTADRSGQGGCSQQQQVCSGRGRFADGRCVCFEGFSGDKCWTESCKVQCQHGRCLDGECRCDAGWWGARCNLRACDPLCEVGGHGVCVNGTCQCAKGWNGPSCSVDGCPQSCNNRGNCRRSDTAVTAEDSSTGWQCVCLGINLWRGAACQYAVEKECSDGLDNDGDGLRDCFDPDCCHQPVCSAAETCKGGAIAQQVLLSEPPLSAVNSFEKRVKFLIGRESVQLGFSAGSIDPERMSVLMGRLFLPDGSLLIASRQWDSRNPAAGHSLSRPDGRFILVVAASGGSGIVSLSLSRGYAPNRSLPAEILLRGVPAGAFLNLGNIILTPTDAGNSLLASSLPASGSTSEFPQVYPDSRQLSSSCSKLPRSTPPTVARTFAASPAFDLPSGILLERQAINLRIPIPDSPFSLVYSSARAAGYKEILPVRLLGDSVPPGLTEVLCQVSIGGSLEHGRFGPRPNLTHVFQWNRMDPFARPLTGLVEARVSVGYKFSHCSRIVWRTHATLLPGAELIPSRLGQWSIDKVHAYDYEAGALHFGDGSTEYLSQRPWAIDSVTSGPVHLPSTRPARWSLSVTATGHVIIADPITRRISILPPNGDPPQTLLSLAPASFPGSTVLYLASDPSSPSDRATVYLSDPGRREILRVPLNLAAPTALTLPFESAPRALTVDRHGVLYYVETYSIMRMRVTPGASTVPETVVAGNGGTLTGLEPWPCSEADNPVEDAPGLLPIRWPVDLACSPLDDSLYFIDDHSVFHVCPESGRVRLIAGRPPHCPASVRDADRAVNRRLRSPQAIDFTAQGELLIAQADGLWVLRSDGRLHAFPVVDYARVSTSGPVSDIAVGPLGHVYLAAGVSLLKLRPDLPAVTSSGYRVASPDASEVFTFSSDGKHLTTEDAVTGAVKYRFEHSTYDTSPVAPALRIRLGNSTFELRHEYHNASIRSPSGRECLLEYGEQGHARAIGCQGVGRFAFDYERRGGGLTSVSLPSGGRWSFRYDSAGRLSGTVAPTGRVDSLLMEATVSGVNTRWRKAALQYDGLESRLLDAAGVMTPDLPPLHSVTVHDQPNGQRELRGQLRCSNNCSIEFIASTNSNSRLGNREWERNVQLGQLLLHRSKWVYSPGQMKLMVNARPVLSVRYDRLPDQSLSASYYGYSLNALSSTPEPQLLFGITYNSAGMPLSVVPNSQMSFYRPVYLKYTDRNRLSEMRWADKPRTASESTAREGWLQRQYDSAGRTVSESRNFSGSVAAASAADDLSAHRFEYSDDSSMPGHILDPVGQTYRFERDPSTGGLGRLVTPTGPSKLRAQTSLSATRLLYWPWLDTAKAVIFQYNSDEALESLNYPSRRRRLALVYQRGGKLSERRSYDGDETDSTRLDYDSASGLVAAVTTDHSAAACRVTQRFSYAAQLLPVEETVEFDAACGLASIRYRPVYHPEQIFVASVTTSIFDSTGGREPLKVVLNTTRHPTRGYVTMQWRSLSLHAYTVSRSEHSVELSDSVSSLKISFDSLGRLVDTMLHVASARVFVLSVHGYSMGRVQELAHRIGKDDDSVYTNVMYIRDPRARVTQVARTVRGLPVDRENLEYRSNGRYSRRVSENQTYNYVYDSRGLPTSVGSAEYLFDSDGFLTRRRNHRSAGSLESFKFDASGQLLTAQCVDGVHDCYRIRYLYDGRQRLVARQDLQKPSRDLQLLYADPLQPDRISHAYYARESQLLAFTYEDRTGRLVAVDHLHNAAGGSKRYYVACDRLGSPLAIFNATGDAVLRQDYSHTGRTLTPVVDNLPFQFPFGYLGGVQDPDTELVWLPSSIGALKRRVYDPISGQWVAPDFLNLFERLEQAQQPANPSPQLLDMYAFDPWQGSGGSMSEDDVYSPDTVGRPEFWLRIFNLDLSHLLVEPALEAASGSRLTLPSSSPISSLSVSAVLAQALASGMRQFRAEASRGALSTNLADERPRLVLNATRRGALPPDYLVTVGQTSSLPSSWPNVVVVSDETAASDITSAGVARAASINNTRLTGCSTEDDDRWVCRLERNPAAAAVGPPLRLDGELETFLVTDHSGGAGGGR